MSNRHSSSGSRITVGTILIILGGLYFLQSLNLLDFSIANFIFSFPFIVFIFGIFILINSRNKLIGVIFTLIGLFTLLPKVLPNFYINENMLWPIILIAVGVIIIFRRREPHWQFDKSSGKILDKDFIDEVNIFGGAHRIFNTDNFKGGNITAIFGGSELDFSQCKLAEGDVIIDIVMIFGGVTFIVPRDWNVRINVTPIFGGFSNKGFRNPSVPIDTSRTLIIKGVTIFGGGEIKTI